jgi:CxxC motif-containing protein
MKKTTIRISGKEYSVAVIGGQRYIDGKTVEEFMKELDPLTIFELAQIGKMAITDEIKGTKPRKYQKMMDRFNLMKN